ncbi:uncharacterized protein [Typha latifolia]|uniref:uncharacterized protein n=1 Tax=Typha latifolia TaxID=4733 RepID=UPI003C2F2CF5
MAITLLFTLLLLFTISEAHPTFPHGLAFESPTAFSPAAFEFFHPRHAPHVLGRPSSAPPLSTESALRSRVRADEVVESARLAPPGRRGVGAGGVVGIVAGVAFAVVGVAGVSYVAVRRRANIGRANAAVEGV